MKKERETLTEKAYRIIKNDILYGKFKQNEVISINALSDELGISRTPITNAFQKLELEDCVTVLPKQGVFVKPITITETREIYELRAAIETFSAKRAFDMINEENIEWLKESVKKQKKFLDDENYQSFMVEDVDFHKYILDIYKNSKFKNIIDNLYNKALMLGIIGSEMEGRAIAAIHEHEQIISALEKKDKESFVTAIEDNVINGYVNLTGNYKK